MKPDAPLIHFNRENLSFALANVLAHRFRSLLTILGIIVGIVTVVLVASILVGVRSNIALLFQEFGPNNIFAYHLDGDPGNPTVKPEELTRKPLKTEFARMLLDACSSLKDAAAQVLIPNMINGRAITAKHGEFENENIQLQGATWNFAQVTNAECNPDAPIPMKKKGGMPRSASWERMSASLFSLVEMHWRKTSLSTMFSIL